MGTFIHFLTQKAFGLKPWVTRALVAPVDVYASAVVGTGEVTNPAFIYVLTVCSVVQVTIPAVAVEGTFHVKAVGKFGALNLP